MDGLKVVSLNLSLSSACGANCIFCPADRGASIKTKNMPFALVERLVGEIAEPAFRQRFGTVKMEIGENGDAFINKEAVEILRMIRRTVPGILISVYTNFQNLPSSKLEPIVAEGLLDRIGLNIDGHDEASFRAVKRIGIKYVNENLSALLKLRKQYNSPVMINVSVLTFSHYVSAVRHVFGRAPLRLEGTEEGDIPDDFEAIKAQVMPHLRHGDSICREPPIFWAERAAFRPGEVAVETYACPLIKRVTNEAFIAPDGTWYACCFDADNQLSLGNVAESSLAEIAASERRAQLVRDLVARRFDRIGGPCATVNCCQRGPAEPV
jgi:sulfatase maturation enzyme AslB (radical SAM superfamily)